MWTTVGRDLQSTNALPIQGILLCPNKNVPRAYHLCLKWVESQRSIQVRAYEIVRVPTVYTGRAYEIVPSSNGPSLKWLEFQLSK